ncbi:MAG: hypothetical protein AB7U73_22625, partial [Pirellulales bacterium]
MNAGTAQTDPAKGSSSEHGPQQPRWRGGWLRAAARLAQTGWSIIGISLLLFLLVDRVAQKLFERG